MIITRLRFFIQSACFAALMYGGRIGLHLGYFFPCFSCPYVGGCSGQCYLMALQGSFRGFQIPFIQLASVRGLQALCIFLGFLLLVVVLNKIWCGWICPFGTLQDCIAWLRKRIGIRESQLSWSLRDKLKPVKYVFLILLIVVPVFIANFGLHPDFGLFFCQICPAKIILPVFEGNLRHFAVDFTNIITTTMTTLALLTCAALLVGCFFKDRFFCIFCPMLALIAVFNKIGFFRLKKNVTSCTGCANCQRICPLDIREVYMEKEKADIRTRECIQCFRCVEVCPGDNTLSVKFLLWKIISSSRKNIVKFFKERKIKP